MKRRSYFRRSLSMLLSALLCLSLAMPAFATDAAGNSDAAESSITLDTDESADTGDPVDINDLAGAGIPDSSGDPGSSGPLASSDAPEDSGQEAPPAEESHLPLGRAWLTGKWNGLAQQWRNPTLLGGGYRLYLPGRGHLLRLLSDLQVHRHSEWAGLSVLLC